MLLHYNGNTSINIAIFADLNGKIFKNFKVPYGTTNNYSRYKSVYILDKLGII